MPRETLNDSMYNKETLRDKAYLTSSNLEKRKALYQYTSPNFIIEDEILTLGQIEMGQSVLDVGCGTGKFLLKVADQFPECQLVGLDISAGVFQKARETNSNIHFATGDVQRIPFADNSFDRVTAMHMLYHAPNIHQALSELSRILKPAGRVLISANSMFSRRQLGLLKAGAARIMNREVFADPNIRFNLEHGIEIVRQYFQQVEVVSFESSLRLENAQPYIDYFDSLREFWQPTPSESDWEKVMVTVKNYVENEIAVNGSFTDITGFGVIIGTKHA